MTGAQVIQHVRLLRTPDVHSISLTGGEPLQAGDFLVDVAKKCRRAGFRTYLETNGADSNVLKKTLKYVDIAAIDIKLPEHLAVPVEHWPGLFKEELDCIQLAVEKGVETFVKIVVLPSTTSKTIRRICKRLVSVAQVPVVLQPVTPAWKIKKRLTLDQMFRLSETAARAGVEEVAVIQQMHKLIGAL
jgi:pyruvate-formate lyase-activating enzyme